MTQTSGTRAVEDSTDRSEELTSVLVTGASGLLGLNLSLGWQSKVNITSIYHHTPLYNAPFDVAAVDLTDRAQMEQVLNSVKPQWIINCAALANLDKCEENPQLAKRINAEMPGWLAFWAKKFGSRLIHISTDAVFDGKIGCYRETDTPNPLGRYATTKLEGEQNVLTEYPDAAVCRVNLYGCSPSGKRSLVEFFYNNLSTGNQVNGFTDVLFCPLFVMDLSEILWKMAKKQLSGLYHLVSSEALSKYDFGVRVARTFGFDECLVKPVSWKDGGLKAARSPDLRLQVDKLQTALGETMPGIAAGLQGFRKQIEAGHPAYIKSLVKTR